MRTYRARRGAALPCSGLQEHAAFVRRENDKWRQITKLSGANADKPDQKVPG